MTGLDRALALIVAAVVRALNARQEDYVLVPGPAGGTQ